MLAGTNFSSLRSPESPSESSHAAIGSFRGRRWRRRSEMRAAPVVADRSDPEVFCHLGHRGKAGFVLTRITDRLRLDEGFRSEQVGKHDDLRFGHTACHQRRWHIAGHGDADTRGQPAERPPALVGEERVVRRCVNLTAGRQPDPENFLHSARENMSHRGWHQAQPCIKRPYRDVAFPGRYQLTQ